jgi:penicillin G amidase
MTAPLEADDESGVAARFDSTSGAIFRVVTTFAEDGTPQAWANFPPGNSGEPGSVHFSDTLDDWVEGRYTRLPFTRDEVEAAAVSTFTMHPDDHGTASRTFPTYP